MAADEKYNGGNSGEDRLKIKRNMWTKKHDDGMMRSLRQ